ncbi:hypothetical protein OG533_17110 [Streptomyces sp. NBC_01186]|uniref:hypothetical protein n=1 Tax=unclassified Streptomyces TaxID=2593676 RepID=UPI002DD9AE7B|nr:MULTISPECIES: hypothetical protein [unclassified Streptomyces]WSB78382.1 hypothetical protein OHB04_23130 [Streptomyces sp. NBC_01775]WSS13415.1 hypothetical protein OG533_17110 [Streptomyces sp. NBC_01186]
MTSMNRRTARVLGAGLGLSALLVAGVPGVASAASPASSAQGAQGSQVSAKDVSAKKECGFQGGDTWINCNNHNYRIRVTYYNNTSPGNPGGEKLLCVKPGETNLYSALPMVGVFTSAMKLNDDKCSPAV